MILFAVGLLFCFSISNTVQKSGFSKKEIKDLNICIQQGYTKTCKLKLTVKTFIVLQKKKFPFKIKSNFKQLNYFEH